MIRRPVVPAHSVCGGWDQSNPGPSPDIFPRVDWVGDNHVPDARKIDQPIFFRIRAESGQHTDIIVSFIEKNRQSALPVPWFLIQWPPWTYHPEHVRYLQWPLSRFPEPPSSSFHPSSRQLRWPPNRFGPYSGSPDTPEQ